MCWLIPQFDTVNRSLSLTQRGLIQLF